MTLATLSRREQNILIIGSAVIIVLLFILYFLQPEWEKYNNEKADLVSLVAKRDTLKAVKMKEQKTKPESIVSLKNQIKALRGNLPVTRETAGLVYLLDSAAKETGANIVEITTGDITQNKNIKGTIILPVNLRITGTYEQIRNFVIKLENLKRLNHISEINVKTSENCLEGDISMEVYSWALGETSLNDTLSIPKSPVMGKPDPFLYQTGKDLNGSGVNSFVYTNDI